MVFGQRQPLKHHKKISGVCVVVGVKQDRFLIVILISILGLVILSLVVFFLRGDTQQYGAEDEPQGVLRNYVLALQKDDFQRAYGYLEQGTDSIDYDQFQEVFLTHRQELARISVRLGSVEKTDRKAVVNLTLIHPANGLFNEGWRENSSALLVQDENGIWKIKRMTYPFWGPDWFPIKTPFP